MTDTREPSPEEIRSAKEDSAKRKKSYAPDAHRLLPQSPDAEKGVLSSCLIAPLDIIGYCIEKRITDGHFYFPAHSSIYSALLRMWQKNEPIDFITLTQKLRDEGTLDQCGGAAFITELFTFLPTSANAPHYVEILEDKFTHREIIKVGTEFAARGYDEQDNEELLSEFEQKTMAIRALRHMPAATNRQHVVAVMNNLERILEHPGQISGLTTGFRDFDLMTDGLLGEQFTVIGARPSHGKTALMLRMVEHMAIECRLPVAIFSLEMSAQQLIHRMMFSLARVNFFRFRDGRLSNRDVPALQEAAAKISSAPIFIDDASGQSIQEIRAKARRLVSKQGIKCLFIDYLQLVKSGSKRARENRTQEVTEVSMGCKEGARETGIPWTALAQVGRDVDKRAGRPRMADLKESGSIEQDADNIAMLSREELYAQTEEQRIELMGMATLDIVKQRMGPIGEIPLTFLKEFSRYEARAQHAEEEQNLFQQ